jgi:hypothetical protein
LSERAKLGLLCLLLLLVMGVLAFTSVITLQAVRTFQHQATAVKRGDVSAIHPWMTVHVVSHICHVPEDYLYSSLQVKASDKLLRHTTLYQLANRKHEPVNQVIHTLQRAILVYRHVHPRDTAPTSAPKHSRESLVAAPGRTSY